MNWPYAIFDFFYTDEREDEFWFGLTVMITNLSQLLYVQCNIIIFAACSRVYRQTMRQLCTLITSGARAAIRWLRRPFRLDERCKLQIKSR